MKRSDLQDERLLEVNFVDIGQGDGTFIVTPDDRFMLIDAGESDNTPTRRCGRCLATRRRSAPGSIRR